MQQIAPTHSKLLEKIKTAFSGGRRHHTYLFYGPMGVGKLSLAEAFARYVLEKEQKSAPLVDLIRMQPTGDSYRVEDFEHIIKLSHHAPFESKYRVVLLEQADRLTTVTANKLLKVLEEPPSFLIFILVSDELDRILPTIQSRCQKISVPPLPDAEIVALITQNYPEEDVATIAKVVSWSEGCLSRALFYLRNDQARQIYEKSQTQLFMLWQNFPHLTEDIFKFVEGIKEEEDQAIILQAWLNALHKANRGFVDIERADEQTKRTIEMWKQSQPDELAIRKLKRQLASSAKQITQMQFRWRVHVNKNLLWDNLVTHLQPH